MSQRRGAIAGMVGPVVFGGVVAFLTALQYDFMVEIAWIWPSGLALGTMGWLQVLNFVFFGLALMVLAVGLHRGVAPGGRGAWVGPALLAAAGAAAVLLGFKVDANSSGAHESWHGLIHGLAFVLFALSLLPAFFFLWRRMRRDPRWGGHAGYALVTGVGAVVLFFVPWTPALFLFLVFTLAWIEVTAPRLRALAGGPATGRVPSAK